jgi:hypothetical protein
MYMTLPTFLIFVVVDFLSYVQPFALFRILVKMYKIISHISIFSSNKTKYMVNLFFNKTNGQT